MPRLSNAAEIIRKYLQQQALKEQSRLPTERELAAYLGLTRGQTRTGLAKLKAAGILWGRVGKGTFLGKEPIREYKDVLPFAFLSNPRDVMEARIAIEPTLASLAALRASPQEIDYLERCVRNTFAAPDRVTFWQWDDLFHQAIAEASGNKLLVALFNAVNQSRQRDVWGSLRERTLTRDLRQSYVKEHEECLAAIRDRDPQRAGAIMREHLESVAAIFGSFEVEDASKLMKRSRRSRIATQPPVHPSTRGHRK